MISRSALRSVTVLCALVFGGCFEDPVKDTLKIELLPQNRARITARTEVTVNLPPENEAARTRAESARVELLNQTDLWSVQFRGLDPIEERYVLEKSDGILTVVERSALVPRSGIETMFRGSPVSVFVSQGNGWGEITIYPGESSRATNEQKDTLRRRMREWSRALEAYFVALEKVVAHLEENPDRSRAVWEVVFEDLADQPAEQGLSEHETAITQELSESIGTTLAVFSIGGEEAYSLQEIGYLVYDPFPSEIRVEVPGNVMESTGFSDAGEIRRVGLWEAFSSLRQDTVINDPLSAWMGEGDGADDGFDLDRFLQTKVELDEPLSSSEILENLESRLRPEPRYSIRWSESR